MLTILDISKSFVNHGSVLAGLNLEIKAGEFFSLLGPSGCGKTTLLRLIAGLEAPTGGEILLNQSRIDHLPARERPFHLVFQRYALFPHLSVFENVAFGLRLKKTLEAEIKERVFEALDLVSLGSLAERWPDTLSGGQQQRVALARALVNRPQILLLDEPLSALDLKLREKMQFELKSLQRKTGITFIFVTHDQGEALALSDRLAVMNKGCIEQVGTPLEVYEKPASLFVADFVGESSFLKEKNALRMLRPEKILLGKQADLVYEGQVSQILFRGTKHELLLQLTSGENLKVFAPTSEIIHVGDKLQVSARSADCPVFTP